MSQLYEFSFARMLIGCPFLAMYLTCTKLYVNGKFGSAISKANLSYFLKKASSLFFFF